LTEAELERIAAKAEEARPRIGTDAEHIGSGGVDRADRRAVKLYETVLGATKGRWASQQDRRFFVSGGYVSERLSSREGGCPGRDHLDAPWHREQERIVPIGRPKKD
jgi:hypothetical protein